MIYTILMFNHLTGFKPYKSVVRKRKGTGQSVIQLLAYYAFSVLSLTLQFVYNTRARARPALRIKQYGYTVLKLIAIIMRNIL